NGEVQEIDVGSANLSPAEVKSGLVREVFDARPERRRSELQERLHAEAEPTRAGALLAAVVALEIDRDRVGGDHGTGQVDGQSRIEILTGFLDAIRARKRGPKLRHRRDTESPDERLLVVVVPGEEDAVGVPPVDQADADVHGPRRVMELRADVSNRL